jgi:alkylation response protein AidB-like acyl-CoA dehydrogenase
VPVKASGLFDMELGFTEEQEMLRDTVRSLCADRCNTEHIRKLARDSAAYSTEFWQGLSETGLTGLTVTEKFGGAGLGALECALVYEEFGRALAVSPHLESCVLAARLLELAGDSQQQAEWLPAIAVGHVKMVVAWQEVSVSADISKLGARAERFGEELIVTGEKVLVPFASSADMVMVLCRLDEDIAAVMVPQAKLQLRAQPNHADQSLYSLALEGVRVPAENLLYCENFADCWLQAMLEVQIALAAQAIGGASQIQAMALEYAQQREQFGQPIGAFQAIAHYLADRATEIEGARYLVYQAAWARDQGLAYAKLAMMAKLQATAVFRRATVTGVQVHGGMGFSEEADPQLFYRRAKHLQLMYGDSRYLEQRIANEVFA